MMRDGDRSADRIVDPNMMTAAVAIELVAVGPQVLLDLLGGQRFHARTSSRLVRRDAALLADLSR